MRSLKAVVFSLAMLGLAIPFLFAQTVGPAPEAPGGFDNGTNGCVTQAVHDQDRALFETVEKNHDGLGPFYNGTSCAGCHSTPISGGVSSITELRAGHDDANGNFIPATAFVNFGQEPIPNRSLIDQKAICEEAQETLTAADDIRALRLTLNVLGDGYVEAIANSTLEQIAANQPAGMQGQVLDHVLALEGGSGVGRFGWKDQHVSLLSFASDAYLNEMGISNRLMPNEADFTHQCDIVPDPEDVNDDIDTFARFMRSTKVPPRDTALASTPDAIAGSNIFDNIGCSTCHVRTIVTAPAIATTPSADVNSIGVGGSNVPPCLANKTIHPFSDFLLHKLGTGDGIVQDNAPQNTAKKIRTAPLWGLRTHTVFLHDGRDSSLDQAIRDHDGNNSEAHGVIALYLGLNPTKKQQLITFLNSL